MLNSDQKKRGIKQKEKSVTKITPVNKTPATKIKKPTATVATSKEKPKAGKIEPINKKVTKPVAQVTGKVVQGPTEANNWDGMEGAAEWLRREQ